MPITKLFDPAIFDQAIFDQRFDLIMILRQIDPGIKVELGFLVEDRSIVVERAISGKEGGAAGYLGGSPERVLLLWDGTVLPDDLLSVLPEGKIVPLILNGFGFTWVNEEVIVESVQTAWKSGKVVLLQVDMKASE